ncbi:MAG: tetratricopeptide repeat protein [Flavobacteriaceae bacterium]|nr:tetratricopeptide repeat protein [Flavobacteriaceae bacterium]
MGEVYFRKGDRIKALEYYSKALVLDPMMPTVIEMVKKLQE